MSAPAISVSPAHHGAALIDAHTPLHALVGFAAGIFGVDPHVAMATFIGARIVEQALRNGTKHAVFGREEGQSLGNEMTDLLFEVGGLHYGQMLRKRLVPTAEAPVDGLGRLHVQPYMGLNLQLTPNRYPR